MRRAVVNRVTTETQIALKLTLDGLIYGLLTGGTFGWLW